MIRSRIVRGLAFGTGALASGALVVAVAPGASAAASDPELVRSHVSDKPYMGARLVPTLDGATVAHVVEGGPMDVAGVEVGDVVVSIDGVDTDHRGALRDALSGAEAGQELTVVFSHGGVESTATVTLGDPADRPEPPAPEDAPWVGARLVRFEDGDGVLVRAVLADSPAADAGLQQGDVVTAIDGTAVEAFWQAQEAVRGHAPGDDLAVTVQRDGEQLTLHITLGSVADAPARPAAEGGTENEGVRERRGDAPPPVRLFGGVGQASVGDSQPPAQAPAPPADGRAPQAI